MTALATFLQQTPFLSYTYSYPHKTAYRPFDPALPLEEVWQRENKDALFLYTHIPFCEMRCGFCNLFTLANPKEDLYRSYLDALTRQVNVVAETLGDTSFARMAIGGGTPTQLSNAQLTELFDLLETTMGAKPRDIPVSCESSPATLDPEKLALLRERGVDRLSIGVQSFLEEDTKALGRPQKQQQVEQTLRWIKDAQFPIMNIDLIYGAATQNRETWAQSLDATLAFSPEEIYLYPLYVRPLTGLGNKAKSWDDHRMSLYLQGRDTLLDAGYEQVSMRMFRKVTCGDLPGPVYRCQEDGMVGLGVGARSYTRDLHYCTEYAVGRTGVKAILHDYIEREDHTFREVNYGIRLTQDDQKRRFAILSLLSNEGLSTTRYQQQFGTDVLVDFPQINELFEHHFATQQDARICLTQDGLTYSDVLGPWLYSPHVNRLSNAYQLR
jgi:oxygen-independent coproporphyrinogen-3 oxidase